VSAAWGRVTCRAPPPAGKVREGGGPGRRSGACDRRSLGGWVDSLARPGRNATGFTSFEFSGGRQSGNQSISALQVLAFRKHTSQKEGIMNRHITLGLAVVAGAAVGAAAVQSLHAQAKPVAYVVSEITVTNQDGYDKEYVPPVVKSIQDGGGKFIARAGRTVTFLGAPPAPRVVLFQFENMEKAQAWFNSPANRAAAPIGEKYATFRSYAVEGLSP
jgi:uncharacterized protein (DUF1330 family)